MLSLAQQFFRTFDYVHFCDCGPHKGTAPCDNARVKISGHHETPGHVWADAATTHVTMTVDDAGVITVTHENILDGVVVNTVKKEFPHMSGLVHAISYASSVTPGELSPLRYYEKGEAIDCARFTQYAEYNSTFNVLSKCACWVAGGATSNAAGGAPFK